MNTSQPTDSSLGTEIFSARRLSGARTARTQGFRFWWLLYYFVIPFVALPYLALMVASVPILIAHGLPGSLSRLLFFGAFVPLYALGFWYAYILPHGDLFILRERGVEIRLSLKHRHLPFDAMAAIYTGRAFSRHEKRLMRVNRIFNPGVAQLAQHMATQSLTIEMKDGKTHVFKVLLTRFEPDDIQRLFEKLLTRQPRFASSDPLLNPSSPEDTIKP